MPSTRAQLFALFSRINIKRHPNSSEGLVRHLRATMSRPPLPMILPKGVRHGIVHSGPLRGERMHVDNPRYTVLYVHGGGYVAGHPRTYRNFASRLAKELSADVYLPDYRLAPEATYPAALDDVRDAYETLLSRGARPNQLVVAGDSAGGGLTLSLLLSLRDRKLPLPRCAVAFSPLADLTFSHPSVHLNDASDDMLAASMFSLGSSLYASGAKAKEPLASPAFGDYTGLCPLFLTVSEQECLRDDAYAVLEKARAANVPVELLSRPDLLHVWPIFLPFLPEARDDLRRIVQFVERA